MAKKKRQRSSSKRKHILKVQAGSSVESGTSPVAGARKEVGGEVSGYQDEHVPSTLTRAIRLTAIVPIVLLVLSLTSHDLWPWSIPEWFKPIVEKQVAVLTLSAGHAGIIGLLLGNKGRSTLSRFSLAIAAWATAIAGFKAIGESSPGIVIAMMLLFLTGLAACAEALSDKLRRFWGFALFCKGALTFMAVIAIALTAFFQARDENYIKNWILIPLGVLIGIAISVFVLWSLMKLGYKYIPTLFTWVKSRLVATYRRTEHRR